MNDTSISTARSTDAEIALDLEECIETLPPQPSSRSSSFGLLSAIAVIATMTFYHAHDARSGTPLGDIGSSLLQQQQHNHDHDDTHRSLRVLVQAELPEQVPAVPINTQPPELPINIQPILDFFAGPNQYDWCQLSDFGSFTKICCGDCLSLQGTGFRIVDNRFTGGGSGQPAINVFGHVRGSNDDVGMFCYQTVPPGSSSIGRTFDECSQAIDEYVAANPESTYVYQNWATRRVLYAPAAFTADSDSQDTVGFALPDESNADLMNAPASFKWKVFFDADHNAYIRNQGTMEYLGSNEYGYLYTAPLDQLSDRNAWRYSQSINCPPEKDGTQRRACALFRNEFEHLGSELDQQLVDHEEGDASNGDPSLRTSAVGSDLANSDCSYWVFQAVLRTS